jgi:tetratricopeptide (TPR) repeat protein
LPKIEADIVRCRQRAGISELSIWRIFYRILGQEDQVYRRVDEALMLEPASTLDCYTMIGLYRECGRERDVLHPLAEWIRKNPDLHGGRDAYLGLVERYGAKEERDALINETSAWLALHPEDANVRQRYLGLVERKGDSEQVGRVVRETSAWLALHNDDNFVRTIYLGLVERKGAPEQVERVLQETRTWLALHPEDVSVRERYLGLVERAGNAEQVEQVLQKTRTWLAQHSLARRVWEALIALLIRSNRAEEAAETALEAISHHPNDKNLIVHYMHLFSDSEDEQVIRRMYGKLIEAYPRDSRIPSHMAAWLRDHNHPDEARALYKSLIARFPREFRSRYGYGRLLLSLGEFQQAIERFRQALKIHKGHQMAHEGLAQAWRGLGDLAEKEGKQDEANKHFMMADQEFRRALYWADINEQPQAIFYTNLGWFYIDRGRYTEALEAFGSAMNDDPDHFGNYWGVGRAWIGLGQFQTAAAALRTALEKAPEDFQPPASEEIAELLKQCQDTI